MKSNSIAWCRFELRWRHFSEGGRSPSGEMPHEHRQDPVSLSSCRLPAMPLLSRGFVRTRYGPAITGVTVGSAFLSPSNTGPWPSAPADGTGTSLLRHRRPASTVATHRNSITWASSQPGPEHLRRWSDSRTKGADWRIHAGRVAQPDLMHTDWRRIARTSTKYCRTWPLVCSTNTVYALDSIRTGEEELCACRSFPWAHWWPANSLASCRR